MYANAYGLVGFRSSSLRVRVVEQRDGYVWCVTASLLDAGTPLTLNASQIEMEWEWEDDAVIHVDGLVSLR